VDQRAAHAARNSDRDATRAGLAITAWLDHGPGSNRAEDERYGDGNNREPALVAAAWPQRRRRDEQRHGLESKRGYRGSGFTQINDSRGSFQGRN